MKLAMRLPEKNRAAPVAASTFETDSVEGQRSRPSGLVRLERLKLVGSRPALRASPDADSPYFSASRSMAAQIFAWESMARSDGKAALGPENNPDLRGVQGERGRRGPGRAT